MFSNVLNVTLIPVFMSNEKEAIHRQSWTKLRQLLHTPGIGVYLNQRQQLKCCRTAWCLCCTRSMKMSGFGLWSVLINELSGWKFITACEHACPRVWPFNSYFCSFSMIPLTIWSNYSVHRGIYDLAWHSNMCLFPSELHTLDESSPVVAGISYLTRRI